MEFTFIKKIAVGKMVSRSLNRFHLPFFTKHLRFVFIPLLLLNLLVVFNSCSNKGAFKVGFLHPSESRQRFVKEGSYFANRIKQLGGEAIVKGANDDEALQLKLGYEMLDEGVSVLVVCPINNNTIAPLIRTAVKRGVKVIAYNRLINNVEYDAFSTNDFVYIAQEWCKDAMKVAPKGNYAIIGGDRFDKNAVGLMTNIEEVLKPYVTNGDITVVFKGYTDGWNKGLAQYNVTQILNAYGDKLDAIISCNDEMADGAIAALRESGLEGKVPLYGQDADRVGVKNVRNGYQRMTFFHPFKELGENTASLAYDLHMGKKTKDITTLSTFNGVVNIPTIKSKSIPITLNNLDVLVQAGLYKREEVFQ